MAVKIRLARGGSKKRPFYRIVAADERAPRDGRYIERLGTYNPLLPKDSGERVVMNAERIEHWLSHGAKPTDRADRARRPPPRRCGPGSDARRPARRDS